MGKEPKDQSESLSGINKVVNDIECYVLPHLHAETKVILHEDRMLGLTPGMIPASDKICVNAGMTCLFV